MGEKKLKKPSIDEVRYWSKKRDRLFPYCYQEEILLRLFKKFPRNNDYEEVLLKCKVLNLFYTTHLADIKGMAKHIKRSSIKIDNALKRGDMDAVKIIRKRYKRQDAYSFATKYCSFHNPSAYPIYDKIVHQLINKFKKQFIKGKAFQLSQHETSYTPNGKMKGYAHYKKVMDAFIHDFNLKVKGKTIDYKRIDKYLWTMGKLVNDKKTT